jgi:HemX protein
VDTTLNALTVLLPLAYLLVTTAYGFLFFAGNQRARQLTRPLLSTTLALHLTYLVLLTLRWSQFPVATVSQALSAVAFAVAVVYAFVEWHGREKATGFWMLAPAATFEILSSLLRTEHPPDREIFHSPLFATHTGLALLGYAAFVIAAGYGFLFLRLYHELKHHRFSLFFDRLPPLETLSRMLTGALVTGFVALSGTVVSGGVWANHAFEGAWLHDPKILGTLVILLFYGVALLLHRLGRYQARHLAMASLAGMAAILFLMIAMSAFSQQHDFM